MDPSPAETMAPERDADAAPGVPVPEEQLPAVSRETGGAETPPAKAPAEPPAEAAEPTIPLEQHQRLLAEFDNYRKRIERERQRLAQAAQGDMMRALLPVLDDLDRAQATLQAPDDRKIDRPAMLKILQLLAEALRREGLERIDAPPGTVFDPNEHEAVLTIPTAEMPEGSVVEALQAGYRLGERLLRPARVIVARAIEPPPEDPGPTAG